jgi:hypothetical protein
LLPRTLNFFLRDTSSSHLDAFGLNVGSRLNGIPGLMQDAWTSDHTNAKLATTTGAGNTWTMLHT